MDKAGVCCSWQGQIKYLKNHTQRGRQHVKIICYLKSRFKRKINILHMFYDHLHKVSIEGPVDNLCWGRVSVEG